MQSTSDSTLDFSENNSGRNTPGNSTTLDFEHQLLAATRLHPPQQQQQQATVVDPLASFLSELDNNNPVVTPSDLDWFLPAPADPLASTAAVSGPDISQFDEDIEQAFASLEPSQINYINNLNPYDFSQQQFLFHRGSLSHTGPLSVITASSESAYNDDARSESQYNPYSPQGSLVNATVPSHFNPSLYQGLDSFVADLAVFRLGENVTGLEGVVPSQTNPRNLLNNNPIQPPSVNIESLMPSSTASGHSFSSFDESGVSSMDRSSPNDQPLSDDAAELEREFGKSTNLINAANYPTVPPQSQTDPRKKYQCPNCPRAFARAFNLKTHMATHDPNRLKPHMCHHTGCGRSFSRKHDLGRHLVSIHKDESGLKMANGASSSSASTYGISGHPLPHVNAHANAGRLHTVGSTDTKSSHQKGSTTPTATSANFLPNIALGSSQTGNNYSQSLGSSFIKTEPKPLTIPGLNHIRQGTGTGLST